MQNEIGEKGEKIFNLNISRDYTFRPMHLGEKWPVSDFYVELIGTKKTMFFIVQIKATEQGLNRNGALRVKLPKKKLHLLNSYYCPTFIGGVDNKTEKVYLQAINKNKRVGMSSLPTKFELNKANRKLLFDEIVKFWSESNLDIYKNKFRHKI